MDPRDTAGFVTRITIHCYIQIIKAVLAHHWGPGEINGLLVTPDKAY